jgi:hypothetical protein
MRIPTYAVLDSKAEFGARASEKAEEEIEEDRASHIATNQQLLKYFDL